jgi:protein involved in polysaccharide export with SLBB domain
MIPGNCRLFFFLWFAVCISLSFAQSRFEGMNVEELKKQIPPEYQKDTAAIFKKLREGNLKEKSVGSKWRRDQKSDETVQPDSLLADSLSVKKEAEKPRLSVYQKLIQHIEINPDSQLKDLEVFGLSVFEGADGQSFEAQDQAVIPSDYVVAPGDEVEITLWGRINEDFRRSVDREGMINIPRLGQVSVAGQSFGVMQKSIMERLQTMEGVQASVNMGALYASRIFIVGEVKKPGQYTVNALSNVTNALFAAGGVTSEGSLRNIQLVRNGRTVSNFDFYDFLLEGDNFNSTRLKSGDVIVVPVVKKRVAVVGNVKRSALYELKEDGSLKQVLGLAGGVTAAAWVNRIQVERYEKNEYHMVFDVKSPAKENIPDFKIQDGDIIKIFPVVEWDKNSVYLSGNVKRPGKYQYKEGLRVSDVLPGYDDCLPETYLDYAAICRKEPPTYSDRLIPFALRNALENKGSDSDILLQPRDTVVIYHRDFFEPDRFVSIMGAVTTPDTFRLMHNMRVKDLILQAGGLNDKASLDRGELYRRTFNSDSVFTEKIPFCVQCAMADDPQHNLELKKMDHVFIRPKRGWEEEKRVCLAGELQYPGEYILLEGESLGGLIRRASGFTDDAYLSAAVFTRRSVKEMEKKRNAEYIRSLESDIARLSAELASKEKSEEANQILQQQMMLLERLRNIEPIGRVVIDLNNEKSYQNFVLEDGDSLIVPKKLNTISVLGEAFNPSTFQHNPQKTTVRDYIALSGGLKDNADKHNVYVIRANGSVVNRQMENVMKYKLNPGDAVVIPQRIRYVNAYKGVLDAIDVIYKVALTTAIIAKF